MTCRQFQEGTCCSKGLYSFPCLFLIFHSHIFCQVDFSAKEYIDAPRGPENPDKFNFQQHSSRVEKKVDLEVGFRFVEFTRRTGSLLFMQIFRFKFV